MQPVATRVLVVEDDALVAMSVCDDIAALDFEAVGPFGTLQEGLQAVRELSVDLALVDVNLRGDRCYLIIDELRAAGVQVALMTGYSDTDIPDRYSDLPRLEKPFSTTMLGEVLMELQMRRRVVDHEAPIAE